MKDRIVKSWHIATFFFFAYTLNGIYQSFITIYYVSRGYDSSMIGIFQSAAPFMAMLAQPLWGLMADRMKTKNRLMRILLIGCGCSVLLFPLAISFALLLVLVCSFAFFQTSIQPLADTITLEHLEKTKKPFGPVRMIGTISFALVSPVAGGVFQNHISFFPYLTAIAIAVVFAASFLLPPVPGGQAASGQKMSPLKLLKNKQLMWLIAFSLPLQITMGFFYTFYPVHFTDILGGSKTMLGWGFFLSALSEIPFLLFGDRLFRRYGAGKLLALVSLVLTVRWVLLGFLQSPMLVLLTQILHGWGFIIMVFSMAKYISVTVPAELKASGQLLSAIVTFGISRIIGSLLGGVLVKWFGIAPIFIGCAVITFLCFLTFGIYHLRKDAPPELVS